jgi:hypothetical protein
MKGYKAFDKGLTCKGFQYKKGETYEESNAEICRTGFHFCENPLDVLDYYDLTTSEFAEVEAVGKIDTDGTKSVTDKIKIGVKLDLSAFIKASIDFLFEKTSHKTLIEKIKAASGYNSQLAASGYNSQLAASGDNSKLAASGDNSKLAASGYNSQLAASGDNSKLAASGDNSQLEMTGINNVGANIGVDGTIKGEKGDWITLAEYEYTDGRYLCIGVKSAKIDGKKIKEDVWYKLSGGKFVAV